VGCPERGQEKMEVHLRLAPGRIRDSGRCQRLEGRWSHMAKGDESATVFLLCI
jgi:hypothetical protein